MTKMISIVSPCYNEEDELLDCYEAVKRIFREELPGYDYEHIFADNGSSDRTPDMLRELAAKDQRVKVILNSRNFGPFRSMFNALTRASGDAVVTFLPIDMQDPPSLLPQFVNLWETGYEVVAGARITREESWMMRKSRSLFYRIVNRLADFEIPEKVGEFQLIDRKVADAVLRYNDHYPFLRGMIAAVGFKRVIVPYNWAKRARGTSKLNILHLVDQAINGILAFTSAPMRLCFILGMGLASLCALYALGVVIAYFFYPHIAPRGITTVIVALFFFSSIQLLFMGVLGEYVTSIHKQVRSGPLVVERAAINFKPRAQALPPSGPEDMGGAPPS